jgi:hypothetical protein
MDSEGNLVEPQGEEHGQVSREVLAGYRCYVMRAWIKTEPREDVDFNTRGNRKTRARTRHAVVVEGPREVVDNSKSRKTRKRQY